MQDENTEDSRIIENPAMRERNDQTEERDEAWASDTYGFCHLSCILRYLLKLFEGERGLKALN